MKAFAAALELENQYVCPNSPIFPKIGGAKEKIKGKEERNKKKRKQT